MKTPLFILALPVLSAPSYGQFWTLPPSSTTDGVTVQDIGANSATDAWSDSNGLAAYASSGDGDSNRIAIGSTNNPLGLDWQTSPSAAAISVRDSVNTNGGTIRAIFVGETAGWLNDFGYTYSGDPTKDSFTVSHAIQSVGPNANVKFGQYIDIPVLAGQANTLDFWLNGVGAMGNSPKPGPSSLGGIYTAFNSSASSPSSATSQFAWSTTPIAVNTYVSAINGFAPVDTYLVSAEDWRIGAGSDRDYSDYTFALQFFDSNGVPLGAVPEPASTACLIGVGALMVGSARRRALES
ncbi:MAG TPA: hypothetical protein VIM69_04620 [Opitutaceae bacterium]